MPVITEPQLQPPGAGLPALETFFLRRLYFPIFSHFTSVPKALRVFEKTTHEIIAMIEPLSDDAKTLKILIPRLTGIEDSSRYWSIMMVLEHLMLVNKGITEIATALAADQQPDIEVSIASVKPRGFLKPEDGVQTFQHKMESVVEQLHQVEKWPSTQLLYHPWLGFLSASQWIILLALHQKLHKVQIEEITKRLID